MGDITLSQIYLFMGAFVTVVGTISGFIIVVKKMLSHISKPLTNINSKVTSIESKLDKQATGLQCSLRQSIISTCKECIKRQSITTEELQSLIDAYTIYEELVEGGNGYINNLYNRTIKLPIDNN